MTTIHKRATASLAAAALVASGLAFGTATSASAEPAAAAECTATKTVTLLGFNDFHGRILTGGGGERPWTGALPMATYIENTRAEKGEDNVAVISAGDNIGATIFESMVSDDAVTIDILNAMRIDASAVGNHELDKGWSDLAGRVSERAAFPYLAANMHKEDGIAPVKAFTIVEKAGLKIGIVGAITDDTPGLVSPGGIEGLTFSDPAAAVNTVTAQLLDGDESNGEADIVVATIHEGASDAMMAALDDRLAGVFTGHTHQSYVKALAGGGAVVQARSYGEALGQITVGVSDDGTVCSSTGEIVRPLPAVNMDNAVVAEINELVEQAKALADEVGSKVIGKAKAAISTPDGGSNVRNTESPMTNMVAQMFFDVAGADPDTIIGVQNPGGTRSSFDAGDITYKEAANTLPFANSLFTTQLTGAQVVQVLEEQWQRDKDGVEYPSDDPNVRPFLQLGLSDNVSYTYDASQPLDQRILTVTVNGEPIDPEKLYTMVSGSFLISGGDQFYTFGDGVNTTDTGRADLEAWVEWVEESSPLAPDYSKRGVEADLPDTNVLVAGGDALTFTFSKLDMELGEGDNVSPKLPNTSITAYLGDVEVGSADVADGQATISVAAPAGMEPGAYMLAFVVEDSYTVIEIPVIVEAQVAPEPKPTPEKPKPEFKRTAPYTLPGLHKGLNGRDWLTVCEPYSQTERCTTLIWGTTIKVQNGRYIQVNGWQFNNLTYLPAKRELWGDNPLAKTGSWTAADGRKWRTECGTPNTGRDGCRSYVVASVIEATPSGYRLVDKEVFNNIVMFSN